MSATRRDFLRYAGMCAALVSLPACVGNDEADLKRLSSLFDSASDITDLARAASPTEVRLADEIAQRFVSARPTGAYVNPKTFLAHASRLAAEDFERNRIRTWQGWLLAQTHLSIAVLVARDLARA